MKTEALFKDLKSRNNIKVFDVVDAKIKECFERKYFQFREKFFYEQFINCGGIIIDNWIRLYGCGELDVMVKNENYNKLNAVDILVGEDILGGLFGLKNGIIYYFAPDTNEWETLDIYYTQFLDWLINSPDDVNRFYGLYRWNTWKVDCQNLKNNESFQFYPLLQASCDIEKRDKKVISSDELIRFNLGI